MAVLYVFLALLEKSQSGSRNTSTKVEREAGKPTHQLNVNMYVNQTKYLELQSGNPYENKQCDRMQLLFCENVLKIISKLPCPGKPLACMTETSRTSLSMR